MGRFLTDMPTDDWLDWDKQFELPPRQVEEVVVRFERGEYRPPRIEVEEWVDS